MCKNCTYGFIEFSKIETKLYNLDVILAVGYRVNTKKGTIFRKWANKILKDYLMKGYVIDESKLYHIGASVKDLGKKIFSIIESDSNMIPNLLKSL